MTRRLLLAVLGASALAGCPLPQPLAEVQKTAATVTPPRILADTAVPSAGIVRVGTSCPTGSRVLFDASLADENVDETVEARWFVDYAPTPAGSLFVSEFAPPSSNPVDPVRTISGYSYALLPGAAGDVHLVELVVSNGFYPALGEPAGIALPHRTAQPGYEVQVYRWTIEYAADGACP